MKKKADDKTMKKNSGASSKDAHPTLKQQVEERTRALEEKTRLLEETNTALKVLLEKRENDRLEIEKRVMVNIEQLINPYLEKLAGSGLNSRQTAYLEILQTHLNEIVSPFTRNLSIRQWNLTPTEMQVAILIKQGRTTSQIAKLLNLSSRTVEPHRRGIRVKFGLTRKKTNLMTYLRSI
jgi:DNA-binding CsgD family transcriptional regulator